MKTEKMKLSSFKKISRNEMKSISGGITAPASYLCKCGNGKSGTLPGNCESCNCFCDGYCG